MKSNQKNAITNEDFPYPLTCKKSELHSFLKRNHLTNQKDFNVAITYHVGMLNNWKDIVKDQVNTLKECGLMDIVDKLMISYSNGSLDDLLQVFNQLLESNGGENRLNITTVESTHEPWEGPAMNMIHQHCNERPQPQNSVVFYLHNKGASKWNENWKEKMRNNQTWTYGYSLYWRKYLEYFLIEHPALCLDKLLLQNTTTCGANWNFDWPPNHYSGNFWSATCKHIQLLKPIPLNETHYNAAEFWIGQYHDFYLKSHASLHNATHLNLYEHLLKPEEYRNLEI